MHDPKTYCDPEEFDPARFLKDGKLNTDVFDPATVAFGAGRRYIYTTSGYMYTLSN